MKSKYLALLVFLLTAASLGFYAITGRGKKTDVSRVIAFHSLDGWRIQKVENGFDFKKHVVDASKGQIGRVYSENGSPRDTEHSYYVLKTFVDESLEADRDVLSFKLPRNADIKFVEGKKIYYYYRFGFYVQENDVDSLVSPSNMSIYDAFFLKNGNILCLGQVHDQKHTVGFFELDKSTKEIRPKHPLAENDVSEVSKDLLTYAGRFCINQDKLSYVYERQGAILFFDGENGDFIDLLNTIDGNPKPEIVGYGNNNTYKRGEAKLSNAAVIRYHDEILALSTFPVIKGKLMLDMYRDRGYESSLQIALDNINSYDVRFLKQTDAKIFLGTKKKLYILDKEHLVIENKPNNKQQ